MDILKDSTCLLLDLEVRCKEVVLRGFFARVESIEWRSLNSFDALHVVLVGEEVLVLGSLETKGVEVLNRQRKANNRNLEVHELESLRKIEILEYHRALRQMEGDLLAERMRIWTKERVVYLEKHG
jgi:hypothetical protein